MGLSFINFGKEEKSVERNSIRFQKMSLSCAKESERRLISRVLSNCHLGGENDDVF